MKLSGKKQSKQIYSSVGIFRNSGGRLTGKGLQNEESEIHHMGNSNGKRWLFSETWNGHNQSVTGPTITLPMGSKFIMDKGKL